MYTSGETSRETTYVLIGSVWMTTLGERCAVVKNSVQVNNYNIYRAPRVRKLRSVVEFYRDTRQRACKRKPNTRSDQSGAKNILKCFIRFQSGSLCRCQMRSHREQSQHRSSRLRVLLHCMHRNCHRD